MGRPKKAMPYVRWSIHIPADLAAKTELILADVFRGGVEYGARSELISQLLRNWIKTAQQEVE
jgi:metal-responsive CopG/Arc/MetJ family transcriptional regulator